MKLQYNQSRSQTMAISTIPNNSKMPPAQLTLAAWIARDAVSFSLDDTNSLHTAVERILAACDPALEILGLGEPTHLVNDYLRLRNRLFQTLVERHGFTAIAIESSFTRGPIADDYVGGGSTSLDDAQQRGITHNMGTMPGNREVLEWLRQYNAAVEPARRVRFYGFDSPTEMMSADSPRQLIEGALDYLTTLNAVTGRARREQILPLIGDDAEWENPAAMMDAKKSIGRTPTADALRGALEDLIAELQVRRPEVIARDAAAYHQGLRCAEHARQMLAYHALAATEAPTRISDMLGLRDRMMADNLRYISEQERPRGRVFVFAQNAHLKRGQALWEWGTNRWCWWPAGAHLSVTHGAKYAVIGVGAGTSVASQLTPPDAGTLEAHLFAAPGPVRVVPTQLGKTLDAANLPTRNMHGNPRYFPFDAQSLTDFDFLALLDTAE